MMHQLTPLNFRMKGTLSIYPVPINPHSPICTLYTGAASPHPSSSTHTKRGHLVELCRRYKLSDEDIDEEVSDEHILEIYPQLVKWKQVAFHLGLTQGDIEAIEGRARPEEELMRLYMLQEWKAKKKIDGTVVYQVLLKVLIKCNCTESASQVCELLSKRDHHGQSSQLVELCKRYELSNDDINKEVRDEHILEIYPQLVKWKRVAAHLGLTQADVEAIEGRARPDEELMRLYMLQEWKAKKKFDGKGTYQALLKVLIKCNCTKSATQVCELLS